MGPLNSELERVYGESGGALFVCALAITRCRATAEDAIHDAFSRLLALERRPADLRMYVFQCVRNAAIDIRRKSRRAEVVPDLYIFEACDPEEQAGRNELASRAAAALLTLSDDERETIVQHLYAGLTFREIADVREDSVNTVASWYRRGLAKLREQLEE